MILDEYLEFVDDAAPGTLTAGTYVYGDVIPLYNTTNFTGSAARPMYAVIQVTEQFLTAGTAGTIQFFLVSDEAANLGSATLASCTEHARTIALVTDDAGALADPGTAGGIANQVGKVIMCVQLPPHTYEKYLGLLVTISTATVTAGKVNAFLTTDPTRWRAYANAI